MSFRPLNPVNFVNLAADPTTAQSGDMYFNTVSKSMRIYFDSAWHDVPTDITGDYVQIAVADTVTARHTLANGVVINGSENFGEAAILINDSKDDGLGINILNSNTGVAANAFVNLINDTYTGFSIGLNSSVRNSIYAAPNDAFLLHGRSGANINYVVNGGSHKFYGQANTSTPRFYINDEEWSSNVTGTIPGLIFSGESPAVTQTTAFPGRGGWTSPADITFQSPAANFVLLQTTSPTTALIGVDATSVQIQNQTTIYNFTTTGLNAYGTNHHFYAPSGSTPLFDINAAEWVSTVNGEVPGLAFTNDPAAIVQTVAFPGRTGWTSNGDIAFTSAAANKVELKTSAVGTSTLEVTDGSVAITSDDIGFFSLNGGTTRRFQITDTGWSAKNDGTVSGLLFATDPAAITQTVAFPGRSGWTNSGGNIVFVSDIAGAVNTLSVNSTDFTVAVGTNQSRLYMNGSALEYANNTNTLYFKTSPSNANLNATSISIQSLGNTGNITIGNDQSNAKAMTFGVSALTYDGVARFQNSTVTTPSQPSLIVGGTSSTTAAAPLVVVQNGAVATVDQSNISLLDSTSTEKWRIGARDGGLLSIHTPAVNNALTIFPSGSGAGISAGALNTITTPTLPVNRVVPVYARRKTVDQTIPSVTDTTCLFETAYTDIENSSSLVGITYSAGTFTNTSGATRTFNIYYQVNWGNNATGNRVVWIRPGGQSGRRIAMNLTTAVNGDGTVQTGSAVLTLANNAFFDIRVYQTGVAGGLSIPGTSSISGNDAGYSTHMSITWL